VAGLIRDHFVPVKIHVKENPAAFQRFGAQWTPTIIIDDPEGTERYRFAGYLPPDEFMAQLELGLAKTAFAKNDLAKAEGLYRDILKRFPTSAAAPEALYWAGVSNYKATNNAAALKDTAEAFRTQYCDSQWAKKASVWAA
jgi:TolA-binding protein